MEHDGAKVLIGDLLNANPGDDHYDAKVKTLSEYIDHHVAEEEKARTGIFAKAQKAGVDMAGLGEKLQSRKTELMAKSEAMTSNPPQPRSFQLQKETSMARNSNDRDRDERGRFTDDGDRGGNQGDYQSRAQTRDRDAFCLCQLTAKASYSYLQFALLKSLSANWPNNLRRSHLSREAKNFNWRQPLLMRKLQAPSH